MHKNDVRQLLQRIQEILVSHKSGYVQVVTELIRLADTDQEEMYRRLNSRQIWGGAESIANEALASNPGIEEWLWKSEIRDFREIMIQLGEHLMSRDDAYPDISSWLLAFNNWNQSDI